MNFPSTIAGNQNDFNKTTLWQLDSDYFPEHAYKKPC